MYVWPQAEGAFSSDGWGVFKKAHPGERIRFFIESDICKVLSYAKRARVHDKSTSLRREVGI